MEPVLLIDITRLFGRLLTKRLPTGVDRVCLAYIQHYKDRAKAVLSQGAYSVVLSPTDSASVFEQLLTPQADAIKKAKRIIWRALLFGWMLPSVTGAILIHTGHHGLERVDFAARLRQRGVRLVCMVHDLIPITHSEYCRPGESAKHNVRITNILNLSSAIITNSQATLIELNKTAKRLNLAMPLARAAHLASGLPNVKIADRPLAAPYFVILGTIEARKNHLLLLQIWPRLIAQLGDAAPRLVIIGQRGWECENVVDLLERCLPLQTVILELPACSDAEIVTWLHHAQALLFPSFIEGYGMPMVEALTLGVPVIASDLAVFHEIAGEIPEYVDSIDAIKWLSLIAAYTDTNHPLRLAQLTRIRQFKAPNWAQHFSKVDAVLEQIRCAR